MFRVIVVPLDGSRFAEEALAPAVSLAGAVPHRLPPAWHSVRLDEEALAVPEADASDYMTSLSERPRPHATDAQTAVVVQADVAQAILETATSGSADVIAIATHGRGGLERAVLGSVADKVIRGASIPVLVHRASQP